MLKAGDFRHSITVRHIVSVEKTAMGADVPVTEDVQVMAKVEALSANRSYSLGFALNETAYAVTIRKENFGRLTDVCINGVWMSLKSFYSDPLNLYYNIIAVG